MKQVILLMMPILNKDNIFQEYEIIYKDLKEQKGSKKLGKMLAKNFFREIRRIISSLPKYELRPFAEKTSKFLSRLQAEGLLDLRKYSYEEGYDLLRLLYDVQGFYEDKLQGDTPRMAMEFMFPYHMFPQGSRVVIYGAGNVGRLIYRQAVHDGYVKIVGIVDRNYEGMSAPDLPVKPVRDMLDMAYDYVFIAIRESGVAYAVRQDLKKLGIPADKVKWDGTAIFRDEFYKNLYFPILRKVKGNFRDHGDFLRNMSVVRQNNQSEQHQVNYGYLDSIKPMLDKIPESNGSRYYKQFKPVIGWITDQILYDAYKSVARGILLTPENYKEKIKEIGWLFIISGWHGIDNKWKNLGVENSESRRTLYQLIDACKRLNIPTVFYSVEDPPNYKSFIGIAQRCDYIFTACIEMLSRYRMDCDNEHVYQMCYGIDPILHNPVGIRKFRKKSEVFFAGSWLERYPERKRDINTVFRGVIKSGRYLRIIDRNLLLNSAQYKFPDEYQAFVTPPIEHSMLQKVHKLYDWSININTVKKSQTMFANRTYELLAMGNVQISNYSVGVNSLLPLIYTCQNSDEIPQILNALSEEELYAYQVMGIRLAMRGNTCYERIAKVLNIIGKKAKLPEYRVAVVVDEVTDEVKDVIESQTYPYKEIVTENELKRHYNEYDIIAFFKNESYYGDFYLEDMINGFKYTDSDYITKDGYYSGEKYMNGTEHDYVKVMPDKYRSVFWAKSFTAAKLLEMGRDVTLANGYSIDHFMYNEQRIDVKKNEDKPLLSVIVPVYNNGMHLFGKCFASLRRSSIFSQMEILLIDDGSTDEYTTAVVRTLEHDYTNVRTYFFNDGGSGSASRPRNKGVTLAKADYITFLDPDNEAINDAYAKMLSEAMEEKFDLVVGGISKFNTEEKVMNINSMVYEKYHDDAVSGGKQLLTKLDFMSMSIQAMIIKKDVVHSSNINQVEGAIGEDTLFSWQLFYYARKIKFVPYEAHIYYAARGGSEVNSINKRFFEKSLLLEREQLKWLKKTRMLSEYMKHKFNYFFSNWYLEKLKDVSEKDKKESTTLVMDIYNLYKKYYDGNNTRINEFAKS